MPVSLSLAKPSPRSKKRVFFKRVANKKATLSPKKTRATKSLFKPSFQSKQAFNRIAPSLSEESKPQAPSSNLGYPSSVSSSLPKPSSFSFNSDTQAVNDTTDLDLKETTEEFETSSDSLQDQLSPQTSSATVPLDDQIVTENTTNREEDISRLKQLIEETSEKISSLEKAKSESINQSSPTLTDPLAFDGLNSGEETTELLKAEIQRTQRQNTKLQHQLEQVKQEFEQEKQQLEKTIKELKSELHRSIPLQENKFFSLSKELQQAVSAIEKLTDDDVGEQEESMDPNLISNPSSPPQISPSPTNTQTKSIQVSESREKKSTPKEVKIAVAAGTAAVILFLGGILTNKLTQKPAVNQQLVDSYITETGKVKGAKATDSSFRVPADQGDRNLDLPYDQTQWSQFEDPILNIAIAYPPDLVERLQTGNSITFLRKEGFLVKVQVYNSEDSLTEFWEKQKNSGLQYSVEPFTFIDKEAIHLHLEDQAEYPGDRYLIKNGNQTYDIWYATKSDKFSPDDIKRAKHMLDSFKWLD